MWNDHFDTPTNPYHYVLHCIGGKWKMTILHEIHTYGSIRFNQTLKALPISEKVFSQQLRELVEAGLIRRISYDTIPPKVEYVLTPSGEQLIPALDALYIWSIRQMDERASPLIPMPSWSTPPANIWRNFRILWRPTILTRSGSARGATGERIGTEQPRPIHKDPAEAGLCRVSAGFCFSRAGRRCNRDRFGVSYSLEKDPERRRRVICAMDL